VGADNQIYNFNIRSGHFLKNVLMKGKKKQVALEKRMEVWGENYKKSM
jgi:hypothetical protein